MFVQDDLNPLSLLHGGDPAAHIAAIERSLAAQAEASISPARPSKLSEIPECEELCEDDTGTGLMISDGILFRRFLIDLCFADVMVDPAPQGKGLPMSMLAPSKSNQLLSSFAPHLVVDPSSPVASSRPVEFQLPPQDTDVRVPLPFLPRLGVVVLSEFCISAQIMNSHLSVNPWNIDDVAKAIEKVSLRCMVWIGSAACDRM